jgi:hypothetical protein
MHTFSCAVQSVAIGDMTLRFDADPDDYSMCRVYVGDHVATFNRNGMLIGVEEIEPPKDPDAPVEDPAPEAESDPSAMAFPSEPEPLSPKATP